MASLTDLTPEAVEQAMDEFDQLGREAFLAKYGFGEAQRLYIVRDTKRYDIKAIVGAAMGYLPGREPLTHDEFSSGLHLLPLVQSLGFEAIDTDADEQSAGEPTEATKTTLGGRTRNPRWSVEEIILALDVYLQHGLLDDTDPVVVQLSDDLNALDVHDTRPDADRWRNTNGAALKLANFAHFDPGYPGKGMEAGSRLDQALFERLSAYPDLVSRLADDVRAGVRFTLDALPMAQDAADTPASSPAPSTRVTSSFGPVEQHLTHGKIPVRRSRDEVEAERIEQPLVHRFCAFLEDAGYGHGRRTYRLDGVDYPCDLIVPDVSLLIEAKAKVTRASLRMAVGQLKDYDFMHADEHGEGFTGFAVLLRGRPSHSAVRYLQREQIGAIWAVADGWAATDDVRYRLDKCRWTSSVRL